MIFDLDLRLDFDLDSSAGDLNFGGLDCGGGVGDNAGTGQLTDEQHTGDAKIAGLEHENGELPYLPTNRFSANGHSASIHCASHRKPASSAIWNISFAEYLWLLSVQIVSPFRNST